MQCKWTPSNYRNTINFIHILSANRLRTIHFTCDQLYIVHVYYNWDTFHLPGISSIMYMRDFDLGNVTVSQVM